jgi:Ca-activated chloride channel homolog
MFAFASRHVVRFVVCALLFVTVRAQTVSTPADTQQEPIKLRTELVVVDAQVIDRRTHQFIRGLKPQDFDLFEDDAKQRIEYFGQDQLPLSIVLLLDVSPSVRPVIEKIRDGALQALQRLRPDDEVALMVFSGWTELIQDFTKDRQLILSKLGSALDKDGSGTRIHEAIEKAASQMRYATNPTSRRVIIAVTDNQGSMERYRDAVSEEEVRQMVIESGATVCGVIVRSLLNVADAVIFQSPVIQEKYKRTSVNPYVEETGGEIASSSKDEVNARLSEVFEHLRSRYSIGYISTNQNHNGKFRRIKVNLSADARKRLGGEIGVAARQGYYAVDRESEELLAQADSAPNNQAPAQSRPISDSSAPSVNDGRSATDSVTSSPVGGRVIEPDSQPSGMFDVQPLPIPPPPEPPRRANPYANLVMLDVNASNRKTRTAIEDLARQDLQLEDNGARREILHFSHGELPVSVIFLIDVTGKTPYVMSSLRRNVALWLRQLRPTDEVALMGFGSTADVVQDFTSDRKVVAGALRDFGDIARQKGIGGGQDRTVGIFIAAEHMDKAANPANRHVIVVITDDSPRSYTLADSGTTARLLLESQTTVYAMVTRGPRPPRTRQILTAAAEAALYSFGNPVSIATNVLTKIGTEALMDAILKDRAFGQMIQKTGGAMVRIDGEDATEKLTSLLGDIRNRYVIGIATPPSSPGQVIAPAATPATMSQAFHTLKLKAAPEALKRHPELSIVNAQGYYVRAPDLNADPPVVGDAEKHDEKNHD